ncbi:metallophosphoesterase family protein [Deinococcus wulumuqiensis]|nr:metallophosphoesterase [Deinococcus wulumuqiensis]
MPENQLQHARAILVQLSDIHLKDDARNPVIQRTEAMVNAVRSCALGKRKDLFIVLSGDLAFKGSPEEYDIARGFLDDLRTRFTSCGEFDHIHWLIVPGNHDCVLPDDDAARLAVADQALHKQSFAPSVMEACLKAQDNYFTFLNNYFGLDFTHPADKLYQFTTFDVGGTSVGFHLFNTAWLSRRKEQPGQLAIPIDELKVVSNGCDTAIGILHHPVLAT